MKVARSVGEVLAEHTTLTLECIDRMYLNVYVPLLQRAAGAAYFFRKMRGAAVPSSALMGPITQRFVDAIKSFAARNRIEIVSFRRGERKDDRTRQYLRNWTGGEGVLYIGKAQEKAKVVRTERRHDPATGDTYPWLAASTAMVNQFYFYAVDDDFGPFFLKFCSYFPYNAKLCINGHEYLKRQLTKRGIAYESLDNGILRCSDPERLQRLANGLTAGKVDALLRKWLARLPDPFTAPDRQQGIRYDVSILQAEFALTQVFDRPAQGRVFFEEVVRENLDMGRPDHVQLIFNRRVNRRTPSRYRTRVITDGVTPSLHVDYKHSRIKQYHKEGRALRTETVINDTYDFDVGRRLRNLEDLKKSQPTPARASASPPTDACSASNASATTAPSAPTCSTSCTVRCASTANAPRRSASATGGCRRSSPPCCGSTCCHRASATGICARRWRRSAGSRPTTTARAA